MKIYFVRHGKTQWNQERRLQGMTGDSPLLPEALLEVAALGDELSEVRFDAIFSSPSKRAVDTAKILSAHNQHPREIIKKTELFEWRLGIFEGMLIDEAIQRDPDNYECFSASSRTVLGQSDRCRKSKRRLSALSAVYDWLASAQL
jgi:probable phosphoglycerate mutase